MKPSERPSDRRVHYMLVISPGPTILVRVPFPMPRWREVMKGLTGVMQEHGYQQKEISSVEGLTPYPDKRSEEEWDVSDPEGYLATAHMADEAFAGSYKFFQSVWLYDWKDGEFVLARGPGKRR